MVQIYNKLQVIVVTYNTKQKSDSHQGAASKITNYKINVAHLQFVKHKSDYVNI
jgi:ATP:corrinoid adenosyltransferase